MGQKQQIESFLNDSRAQADPFYALRLRKLEEINSRRSSIDAQIRSLNDQLEGINSRLSDRPQEEVSLTRFLRDEKIAEEVYTNLLSKLQELELQEAVSPTSMKIIESAAIPEFPLFPQKKITVVLALLFGFFLGSGIVFLQVFLKDTPYSVNAIKSVLPYQFLGVIPEAAQNEEVFFKSSLSSVNTESIRQIHTNLTFKEIYKSDHFNLMVTSAVSGEGKSVTCANLIYPVAETGRRAVLVNLNLRRLVFKDYFRITNKPGITDFLSGNAEFHDIVSCQTENGLEFDIIETGKNVSSPTRSYLFGRCDEFFAQLKRNYNICLFYGAPILTASETLDLSRHMSGIILVADLTYSRMKSIKVLQELLSSKNIPVLGTIINRAKSIV